MLSSTTGRRAAAVLFPSLLAGLFAPIAAAQGQTPASRDAQFVRGLAKDLRFVQLAQEETGRLASKYKSSESASDIALLDLDIKLIGAEILSNPEERRTLYVQALEKSGEIYAAYKGQPVANQALSTQAEAAFEFGEFLLDELAVARRENPDQVQELEEQAGLAFKAGVQACEGLMGALEEEVKNDPQARFQRNWNWLRKGVLQRMHARAVPENREFLVDSARVTLEDFIFEVGEHTALGLKGLFEYFQCTEVTGELETAAAEYGDVIEQIRVTVDDEDNPPPPGTVAVMLDLSQEVYKSIVRALLEAGKPEQAIAKAGEFKDLMKRYVPEGGELFDTLHPRHGHMVLLFEAQAMAESGDTAKVNEALATVQRINDAHPTDYVGLRAKQILERILNRTASATSPDLMVEVAKGQMAEKEYENARASLKRALSGMGDDDLKTYGLEVWNMIARSYRSQDRWLEATLAYRFGLENHGKSNLELAESMSEAADNSKSRLVRLTDNDPSFTPLNEAVDELVAEFGGAAAGDKLHYKNGRRALFARDFTAAADAFLLVSPEFVNYDLAQFYAAYAAYNGGDLARSESIIANYMAWRDTKEAEVPNNRPDLAQRRREGLAQCNWLTAEIAYSRATADDGKNLEEYPKVIDAFNAFLSNYADDGATYVPRSYDRLGRLHAEMGDLDAAEQQYRKLEQYDANSRYLAPLTSVVFKSYADRIDSLTAEKDGLAKAGAPAADMSKVDSQLADTRRKLITLGVDYAKSSSDPQYGVLYTALSAAEDLKDWQGVQNIAYKMIELFGENPDHSDSVDKYVRTKIGLALMEELKFQQAYDMLSAAMEARPRNYELKRLTARCLGGWFEFNNLGSPAPKLGLERYEEAYSLMNDYRPYVVNPSKPKYTLEWYRYHFEALWFCVQAAKGGDDKFRGWADRLYNTAESVDDFGKLKELGAAGIELEQMFRFNKP